MQWTPPFYWLQITQQCTVSWHIEYHWFSGYWPTLGYSCQGLRQDFCNHLRKYRTWLHYQWWPRQPWCCCVRPWVTPTLAVACYSFHISLSFPVCYSRHWMKPPHLGAGDQSLSPAGPSKTAPADGAFTSCLAIYTVLWRMTSWASAPFWNSHTQKRSLLCSSHIMINPGKYRALKTGRALNPEGSGGVSSDRWSWR